MAPNLNTVVLHINSAVRVSKYSGISYIQHVASFGARKPIQSAFRIENIFLVIILYFKISIYTDSVDSHV